MDDVFWSVMVAPTGLSALRLTFQQACTTAMDSVQKMLASVAVDYSAHFSCARLVYWLGLIYQSKTGALYKKHCSVRIEIICDNEGVPLEFTQSSVHKTFLRSTPINIESPYLGIKPMMSISPAEHHCHWATTAEMRASAKN